MDKFSMNSNKVNDGYLRCLLEKIVDANDISGVKRAVCEGGWMRVHVCVRACVCVCVQILVCFGYKMNL